MEYPNIYSGLSRGISRGFDISTRAIQLRDQRAKEKRDYDMQIEDRKFQKGAQKASFYLNFANNTKLPIELRNKYANEAMSVYGEEGQKFFSNLPPEAKDKALKATEDIANKILKKELTPANGKMVLGDLISQLKKDHGPTEELEEMSKNLGAVATEAGELAKRDEQRKYEEDKRTKEIERLQGVKAEEDAKKLKQKGVDATADEEKQKRLIDYRQKYKAPPSPTGTLTESTVLAMFDNYGIDKGDPLLKGKLYKDYRRLVKNGLSREDAFDEIMQAQGPEVPTAAPIDKKLGGKDFSSLWK